MDGRDSNTKLFPSVAAHSSIVYNKLFEYIVLHIKEYCMRISYVQYIVPALLRSSNEGFVGASDLFEYLIQSSHQNETFDSNKNIRTLVNS